MKNTCKSRIISLGIYLLLLSLLFHYTGHLNIENKIDTILLSAFVVMAINLFIVEPFFTKPTDVISASLNLLLLFIPISISGYNNYSFYLVVIYAFVVLAISSLAILLFTPYYSANYQGNKASNLLKKITVFLGKSKYLFGFAIITILFEFYGKSDCIFFFLIIMYLLVLFLDKPKQLLIFVIDKLLVCSFSDERCTLESIGEVLAIQSNEVYIINVFKDLKSKAIKPFDWLVAKNIHDGVGYECLVIDIYTLEDGRKIKALKFGIHEATENLKDNVAYKISEPEYGKSIRENFVGVVCENSDISQIKFEYLSEIFISDGDLLKVSLRNKDGKNIDVIYQVIQAMTNVEYYDNKNEVGLITATAVQFGVWQETRRNFEYYGWVPNINTPVFLARNITGPELKNGEIKIGTIPNTEFNVLVNSEQIITHHLAVLGTTGSGKSVFARRLIKDLVQEGNKIFCLDFTDEIKKYLTKTKLIDEAEKFEAGGEISYTERNLKKTIRSTMENKDTIVSHIRLLTKLRESIYGRDPDGLDELSCGIVDHIKIKIMKFLEDDNNICLVELTELSNTVESLEFTKMFFKAIFDLAKENCFESKRVCIVLEEAHTLIPEWNSVGGVDEKFSRRVTNTIAQIALQGRKFNVGMMIIAQRTANISKTILTQCNTIISFKQYDETSKDFLSNHFGAKFASNLPILKNRQAIISGKALVSDVPIIFDVPNIEEDIIEEKSNRLNGQEDNDDCPF